MQSLASDWQMNPCPKSHPAKSFNKGNNLSVNSTTVIRLLVFIFLWFAVLSRSSFFAAYVGCWLWGRTCLRWWVLGGSAEGQICVGHPVSLPKLKLRVCLETLEFPWDLSDHKCPFVFCPLNDLRPVVCIDFSLFCVITSNRSIGRAAIHTMFSEMV